MRTCLKNMKYIYYNNQIDEFGYYVGNCYIENGIIIGFGNEEAGFDNVIDMTGKLVMPMISNMNINLEEVIYGNLKGNWDSTKVSSFENTFGTVLMNKDSEYYEGLAPRSISEVVNSGTGLITTRRCWKSLSKAPIFALCGYPITRNALLKNYLDTNLFTSIIDSNNSPNILHGFYLKDLASNDEGTLSFAKNYFNNKMKFVAATIGQDTLSKNLVKQKWMKDELTVLSSFGLLRSNTLLFGCNELSREELYKIKDSNATMVYTPIAAKTLSITPGNPEEAEEMGIPWCLASGATSKGVTANMIYHMQELKKAHPNLNTKAIMKAVCVTPLQALLKISGVDISGQANFTVIDTDKEFIDINDFCNWLFTEDYNSMHMSLMIAGNFVSYNMPDTIEESKNYLRSFYKHFDMFIENPNMFLSEVPQKI